MGVDGAGQINFLFHGNWVQAVFPSPNAVIDVDSDLVLMIMRVYIAFVCMLMTYHL